MVNKKSFLKKLSELCYNFPRISYWLIGIIIFVIILLTGCVKSPPKIEYITQFKEVYIPVKCEISIPVRPVDEEDIVKNTRNILIYTEKLEKTLEKCK